MASTQRLPALVSNATARASSPSYICKSCRSKLLRLSPQANTVQLRHASNQDLPWTEKVRRKMWGTDNPPGLADPYGGPSFLEKRKTQRQQRAATRQEEEATQQQLEEAEKELEREEQEREIELQAKRRDDGNDVVLREDAIDGKSEVDRPQEYKPAKTWDGLRHIGHTGHWEDSDPTEADQYRPWYANEHAEYQMVPPQTREETADVLLQAASEAGSTLSGEDLMQQRLHATDPLIFQTFKNFTRLSGHQFSDTQLNAFFRNPHSTYASIVEVYLELLHTPAPRNLYEKLTANDALLSQSNVMVLPRRETPVDKEKEVGRWKVIEKELKDRGLPVLGRVQSQT